MRHVRRQRKREKPSTGECCVCEQELQLVTVTAEERPTGDGGETETWYYCSVCWERMHQLREMELDLGRLFQKVFWKPEQQASLHL